MFLFNRIRTGTTEIFNIILPESSSLKERRFGEPLRFNRREERYYDIGKLILIHESAEIEYFLYMKQGLSESEQEKLMQEIELLAGSEVHTLGGEPELGWFLNDCLRR